MRLENRVGSYFCRVLFMTLQEYLVGGVWSSALPIPPVSSVAFYLTAVFSLIHNTYPSSAYHDSTNATAITY